MEVGEEREERFGALVQLPHPEHALVDVDTDIAVGEGRRLRDTVRARGVQDDRAVIACGQRMVRINRRGRGRGAVPGARLRGDAATQLIACLPRAGDGQSKKHTL